MPSALAASVDAPVMLMSTALMQSCSNRGRASRRVMPVSTRADALRGLHAPARPPAGSPSGRTRASASRSARRRGAGVARPRQRREQRHRGSTEALGGRAAAATRIAGSGMASSGMSSAPPQRWHVDSERYQPFVDLQTEGRPRPRSRRGWPADDPWAVFDVDGVPAVGRAALQHALAGPRHSGLNARRRFDDVRQIQRAAARLEDRPALARCVRQPGPRWWRRSIAAPNSRRSRFSRSTPAQSTTTNGSCGATALRVNGVRELLRRPCPAHRRGTRRRPCRPRARHGIDHQPHRRRLREAHRHRMSVRPRARVRRPADRRCSPEAS